MFVIRKGCVAVIGKQEELMGVLGQGQYFGEIALFTQVSKANPPFTLIV
jgi:signal-transduction protein with cAMP-binding, CBS, and nucleotidyltransferase domain